MAKSGTPSKLGTKGSARSTDAPRRLVDAAIETLKADGYAGASARVIAGRAGCNQGLVFYHFGSVANLLLAALDAVSERRLLRYREAVEHVEGATELVEVAATMFREDLDSGYVTVLVEMIAGASSTPGLGPEVASRIAPWTAIAQRSIETLLVGSPLGAAIPSDQLAYAIVALYLGFEMLTQLDGDRDRALALFEHAKQLATIVEALGIRSTSAPPEGAL